MWMDECMCRVHVAGTPYLNWLEAFDVHNKKKTKKKKCTHYASEKEREKKLYSGPSKKNSIKF